MVFNKEQKKIREVDRLINVSLIKSEMQQYHNYIKQHDNLETWYYNNLDYYDQKIKNYEEQLKNIKSPNTSEDIAVAKAVDKSSQINSIMDKIKDTKNAKILWLKGNNSIYFSNLAHWNQRIATVLSYVESIENEKDKDFIRKMYIEKIDYRELMKEYEIKENCNLYRKATNILKKLV